METNKKNYKRLSKDELIKEIESMEELINQMALVRDATELEKFPWVGNLGHWHWNIQTNRLVFNKKKATNLGFEEHEIPKDAGFEYFTKKLHPEDYEDVMENMRRHLLNDSEAYEVEYRIENKDGSFSWYYDRGKVTARDVEGNAINISGVVFDISKTKAMEEKLKETNNYLRELSRTDELTGIYNRRFLIEMLNVSIEEYNKLKKGFSLIMLDIDDFKTINDQFGHNIGDIILQNISDVLLLNTRKKDIIARWGGEEFILLLPDTKVEQAVIMAETIRIKLENMKIKDIGKVTASFGVSNYVEGDSLDSTVKKVDDLMYKAKDEGKNCIRYQIYD